MTRSEQIAAIVADLTEEESRQLGTMLLKRAENMREDAIAKAKAEFIKAYDKYRKIAPNAVCIVTVESEELYEVDIDLYAYMDDYL